MNRVYWNWKRLAWRKTKSKNTITLSERILLKNKTGIFGPPELKGNYVSTINGEDFMWTDLNEALINPESRIKIYNPIDPMYDDFRLLD